MHYTALTAMFNPLHSNSNQELFEKHLCNQSIYCAKEAITCVIKSTSFAVSKDEWNTKEGRWQVREECNVHTALLLG